jgi:hypothetical protein
LTSAGTAVIRLVPGIGTHSYTAVFKANTSNAASTSSAQPLTVTGLYPTAPTISPSGSAGNYTLTGGLVGTGSEALAPTGSLSFLDTTNGNYIVGSATLGAATLLQSFAAQVTSATGSDPESIAVGDFNGDGYPDLVVANYNATTVSVFLGTAAGTFGTATTYTVGSNPYSVAVGDFNGDGRPDIAVANYNSNNVSILLNTTTGGTLSFATAVNYAVGTTPYAVAVGDFNSDGNLDLAVANYASNNVSVLLGTGTGTFAAQSTFAVGTSPLWVAVGDQVGNGQTGAGGATGGGAAGTTGNNGLTDTATVVTASAAEITVGGSVTFTATVTPTVSTGTVTFFSNGTFIETVPVAAGVATWTTTTLVAGTASIMAAYSGDGVTYNGSQSQPIFETVDQVGNGQTGTGGPAGGAAAGSPGNNGLTNTATQVSTSAATIPFGSSLTFTAAITPNTATGGTVSFFCDGTYIGVANLVNGAAQWTTSTLTVGTHQIVAAYSGTVATYNESAATAITQIVGQATPVITWATPAAISFGTALSTTQLNATASAPGSTAILPGSFAYTPAAGTILSVGNQTLSVTFTPTNSTDYSTATKTVQLVVNNKPTPIITWATPTPITFGTALSSTQLDATASAPGSTATLPGSFTYTPAAGTIPSIGNDTLSATFTPTDSTDYNTATATVTLVVNTKSTPTIKWPAPAAIEFGSALSSTQLDASATGVGGATLPGSFVYSPAAGTVPAVGSDTLSVTFTPTDTTDYNTATATVTLTVAGFTLTASGSGTVNVNVGAAATFNLTAMPVGTSTFLAPVTFSVSGLPPGATATFSPATVPAGSGSTPVTLVVQTSASSAVWNTEPQGDMPHNLRPMLLMLLLLPLLGMQRLRKRMQLAPRWLTIVLFAALSMGAVVGLTGCSASVGTPPNGSTTYNLVVTETSGTVSHTFNLTLVVQK